jgi:hypothetical protein
MATDSPLDADRRSTAAPPNPALIRCADQRVRVFVSSTLDELAPERAAAREAISQLRLTPVLIESGARPYPPRELYQAYLAQSDIFVGIYWQRYGWVASSMQVSGLEDEYQLAGAKPKLIYIKTLAPEREPRLQALLNRIRAEDIASYQKFATPEELRERIANDLAQVLTERFTSPPETAVPARLAPLPRSRLIDREQERAQGQAASARRDWPCRWRLTWLPGSQMGSRSSRWLRSKIPTSWCRPWPGHYASLKLKTNPLANNCWSTCGPGTCWGE